MSSETPEVDPNTEPPPIRTDWAEVFVVLCVGIIPFTFGAVAHLGYYKPGPYWAGSLLLIGESGCIIYVTLYLVRRSGQSWGDFGLARPGAEDLLVGLALLILAEGVWRLQVGLGLVGSASDGVDFPTPRTRLDYWLMTIKFAIAGLSEEVVCRGYLVTRLGTLLRSRGLGMVVSAGAFASYHLYQGPSGLLYTFLFGLAYGGAFLAWKRVWPFAIGHALYNMRIELLA